MKTKQLIGVLLIVALLAAPVVLAFTRHRPAARAQVQVAASFYPLYEFARQVGGDKVQVTNMTPAGAEPHDFEPSPQALATAQDSDMFIYNGGTLEPWTANFLHDFHHVIVKASTHIDLRADTEETGTDPHFWLDPVLAQQVVDNVRDGLGHADPEDAAYFAVNAAQYKAQLAQLDRDFQAGLTHCQTRTIVTSHAAFGYLAARYHLDVLAITGVDPDQEPSSQKLADIARTVRERGIHYVFFERLVSPKLADTIATETGAKTIVFDPLEGINNADQKAGKTYLSVQRDNLAALRTVLACQ